MELRGLGREGYLEGRLKVLRKLVMQAGQTVQTSLMPGNIGINDFWLGGPASPVTGACW